jgi:hypothetical protein
VTLYTLSFTLISSLAMVVINGNDHDPLRKMFWYYPLIVFVG